LVDQAGPACRDLARLANNLATPETKESLAGMLQPTEGRRMIPAEVSERRRTGPDAGAVRQAPAALIGQRVQGSYLFVRSSRACGRR